MWYWTAVFVFVRFEPAIFLLFRLLGYGENEWTLIASLAEGSHHFTAQWYYVSQTTFTQTSDY